MSAPDTNRRGSPRKRPRGWIKIECRGRHGFGPNIAHTLWDISQTGVCLVTKSSVSPGEVLEVKISSNSHQSNIATNATVVWVDPLDDSQFTVGLRFNETLSYGQVSQLTV
jgi:hypothetical protein